MYSLERTFTSCVALGKLPDFSVPEFPKTWNWNVNIHLTKIK